MSSTPTTEPAKVSVMWGRWCEHPGCKKWGSFGTTTGTQAHRLCYDHNSVTQANKAAS